MTERYKIHYLSFLFRKVEKKDEYIQSKLN